MVGTTFAQLGLSPALVEAVAAEGYAVPTTLQGASIPVLRRGGNAVLHGSTGAGLTAAYVLPLLDRLAGEAVADAPPLGLILVPTETRAAAVALMAARWGAGVGLTARALAPGWGTTAVAHIVVATPPVLVGALRRSALKIGHVQVICLEGLSWLLEDAGAEALEVVLSGIPRDAQRVVATAELSSTVEHFVEAHVRRALSIPPRPAAEPAVPPALVGTVSYTVVDAAGKNSLLGRVLESAGEKAAGAVLTRTADRAREVREELVWRGFSVRDPDGGEGVLVATLAEAPGEETAIAYDVPPDAVTLRRAVGAGGVVLVVPEELPHLRQIAGEAGLSLVAATPAEPGAADALSSYRAEVRSALAEEDLAAQLLVLEPLFREASPAEVAAALSALLRRRVPIPSEPAPPAATARPVEAAFVRLFVSAGERDHVGPGDLVGAITGEAGIRGDQVGRIQIRDTFSVVEVAASVAEKVIRALNGTTVRGRSLRVDYDRKGPPSPPRRGRRSG